MWTVRQEELLHGVPESVRTWLSIFGYEDQFLELAACNMLFASGVWYRLTTTPDVVRIDVWTAARDSALKAAVGGVVVHPAIGRDLSTLETTPPDWTHEETNLGGPSNTRGLRLAVACYQFLKSFMPEPAS